MPKRSNSWKAIPASIYRVKSANGLPMMECLQLMSYYNHMDDAIAICRDQAFNSTCLICYSDSDRFLTVVHGKVVADSL